MKRKYKDFVKRVESALEEQRAPKTTLFQGLKDNLMNRARMRGKAK